MDGRDNNSSQAERQTTQMILVSLSAELVAANNPDVSS